MGAISGLLGTAGGVNGSGIQGPQQANLMQTVSDGQLSAANTGTNVALDQQAQFLQAVQAQNGLGNQSQVYNQLQGVVNGTGPNPAQAQLAQATAANTANQAALMAGQRGASQNTGLIARQAAMQGGANQQASAGQAATLQANQSLNALGTAGTLAGNQAAQQASATSANTQAFQNQQNNLLNAAGSLNASTAGVQSNINSANSSLIGANMNNQASLIGGALNGAAAAGAGANGGMVKRMATGGDVVPDQTQPAAVVPPPGPTSTFGKFVKGFNANQTSQAQGMTGSDALRNGMAKFVKGAVAPAATPAPAPQGAQVVQQQAPVVATPLVPPANGPSETPFANGGKVSVLLSPGELKLSPEAVKAVENGASPRAVGQVVPGEAKVKGAKNSYANDIVPDQAAEGTVIIPRSATQSKNSDEAERKFVSDLLAKHGKSLPKKSK